MTYYPYKQKKEDYIKMMSDHYGQEYSNLPKPYITTIINHMIDRIDVSIDSRDAEFMLMKVKNVRLVLQTPNKTLSQEEGNKFRSLAGDCLTLYSYKKGAEFLIKRVLGIHDPPLEYPTDIGQQQLLSTFTQDALRTCATEICNATEQTIKEREANKSWTEKFAPIVKSKPPKSKAKTWAEKHPTSNQNLRSDVEHLSDGSTTTTEDSVESPHKKRKVSFADHLATKSQPTFPAPVIK